LVPFTCTSDVNRKTVFFVVYRQETVLRCCGGDSGCGGDGWPGKSKQQRPARWARRRLRSDSSEPTTDDRRPKYRRVSGRTTSSIELPATADDDDDDEICSGPGPGPNAELANCWRRALTELSATGNTERRHDSSCSNSAGSSGGNCDDSSAASGDRGRRPVKVPPAIALSNWTVISNSSLRDVDSEDLRDELVGYATDASAMTINGETTYY